MLYPDTAAQTEGACSGAVSFNHPFLLVPTTAAILQMLQITLLRYA
jgi:hypothetical protein